MAPLNQWVIFGVSILKIREHLSYYNANHNVKEHIKWTFESVWFKFSVWFNSLPYFLALTFLLSSQFFLVVKSVEEAVGHAWLEDLRLNCMETTCTACCGSSHVLSWGINTRTFCLEELWKEQRGETVSLIWVISETNPEGSIYFQRKRDFLGTSWVKKT